MTGKEEIIFKEDGIYHKKLSSCCDEVILDPIMHIGEKNLMKEIAALSTKNGGDILEVGFGMHLSADFVQENPLVTSHTIIEVHPEIYKKAIEWAKDKNNVEVILGDWIDVVPNIKKKFDGILHDTHNDNNIPNFLDSVKHICKEDCIVSFFVYPKQDPRLNEVIHHFNGTLSNYGLPPKYPLKYTVFNKGTFVSKNIFGEA